MAQTSRTGMGMDLYASPTGAVLQKVRGPRETPKHRGHLRQWQFGYDVDMSPRHKCQPTTPPPRRGRHDHEGRVVMDHAAL